MANGDDSKDDGAAGKLWAKELVKRIGAEMKELRGARPARWLSERTAELGYPIPATVIAKLDTGHRGEVLSVVELLVLAAALDVTPTRLLYPGPYDREVELIPGKEVSEFVAAQWFSGLYDHAPPVAGANFYDYRKNLSALRNVRVLDELRGRKKLLVNSIAELGDDVAAKRAATLLADQIPYLDDLIRRYEQDGDDG